MISDARAQEAFDWLDDNTEKMGAAKARLERSEIMQKRTRKRAFVLAPDGSVASKEAFAETYADVIKADRQYVRCLLRFEALKARQEVESIALDVWRTVSANRRKM